MKLKALNILVPETIHTRLKVIAAEESKSMKDIIIKSVEQYHEVKHLRYQLYRLKNAQWEKEQQ